jgi:polo-like kinase 1
MASPQPNAQHHYGSTPLHRRPLGYAAGSGGSSAPRPTPGPSSGGSSAPLNHHATPWSATPSAASPTSAGGNRLQPPPAQQHQQPQQFHYGNYGGAPIANRFTAQYDAAANRDNLRTRVLAPPTTGHHQYQHQTGGYGLPPQSGATQGGHRYYVEAATMGRGRGPRPLDAPPAVAAAAPLHGFPSNAPPTQQPPRRSSSHQSRQASDMWRQQPTTHQNPTRTNFQQPAQRRSASSNARPSHSDPYGPNPSATPGPVRPVLRPHSQDVIEERSELPDEVTGEFALLHRYRCGALLGRGGFAKVYHFVDLDTAEEFAAKVIDKTRLKDNGKLEKLLIEIRIHEKLDHPNVLKIHRHFQDSSYMYILLEKCPNQTLLELSRARISLTVQETQYMMLQLLCGVEYLHRANVIHRDLKLANVLVDADLNLKIGDFGLAAAISHTEEVKRTMCGTPNYIAPEILAAGNQSPRSGASRGGVFAPVGRAAGSPTAASHGYTYRADYWSIGVILYTLFVGCPPFETEDLKTTYDLIQRASYTIPPSVPRAAARLIQRILQVNPEHRPSLVEMRSDPFFAGCRADAPPPPTLIEYYARLHGTSPAEYEAHVLGRHSARRRYEAMVNQPQQVQPLYLATPTLTADAHARTPAPAASGSPSAPFEASPQSAVRRLFTPSRDEREQQQAPGGQEDQPRPPPSVLPQALQVQAGGMYLYRAESLSPLLGNSPLGPVGAALGFPAHDVGATAQRQGAVSPAGSEGFYSPTGMRPQSPASPTTAAAGGDDFLTPVLESLIKAQSVVHGEPAMPLDAHRADAIAPAPLTAPVPSDFTIVTEMGLFHRYGVGYRTHTGHTGAYFNDRSRLVYDEATGCAEYHDRPVPTVGGPNTFNIYRVEDEPPVDTEAETPTTTTAAAAAAARPDAKKATLGRFFADFFTTRRADVVRAVAIARRGPTAAQPTTILPVTDESRWAAFRNAASGPPVLCCVPGTTRAMRHAVRSPNSFGQSTSSSSLSGALDVPPTMHVANLPNHDTLSDRNALRGMVHVRRCMLVGVPQAVDAMPSGSGLPPALRWGPAAAQLAKAFPSSAVVRAAVAAVPIVLALAKLSNGDTQVSFFCSEYAMAQNFSGTDRLKLQQKAGDAPVDFAFDPDRPFPPMVVATATVTLDADGRAFSVLLGTEAPTSAAADASTSPTAGKPTARFATYAVEDAFRTLHAANAAGAASAMLSALRGGRSRHEGSCGRDEVVLEMSDAHIHRSATVGVLDDDVTFGVAAALWLQRTAGAVEVALTATGASSPGALRIAAPFST